MVSKAKQIDTGLKFECRGDETHNFLDDSSNLTIITAVLEPLAK